MRLVCLFLILATVASPIALALEKEEIEALLKKPHSRENLVPELGIYADMRKFSIEITFHPVNGEPGVADVIIGKEKVVDGKYIVSEVETPAGKIVMVVHYDRKRGLYLKHVLSPENEVHIAHGISPKGSRAIAWIQKAEDFGAVRHHVLEQHTDEGVTWTEILQVDDEVVNVTRGTARKIDDK